MESIGMNGDKDEIEYYKEMIYRLVNDINDVNILY